MRLTLSSLATPHFATSYTLGSVGIVDGSISYLYSSIPLVNVIAQSEKIPLTTLFRSYQHLQELPRLASPATVLDHVAAAAGGRGFSLAREAQRLVKKPTLLYGRLYLPRSMLEALVIKRVSPSVQLQLMAVSEGQLRNGGTLLGMVQYDHGRYGIEGLASSDGGLLGLRGLYNFGGDTSPPTPGPGAAADGAITSSPDEAGTGASGEKERIYGRFSAGGEVYYGTLNKSGGVSLGARFATLPAHRGTPLTATMTINPLMGNISTSYAVLAREYCSLATKLDFNVYSYESDWAIGMELWSKRKLAGLVGGRELEALPTPEASQWKERSFQAKLEWRQDEPEPTRPPPSGPIDEGYQGVLKARLDQNLKIGLLWEGRVKSLLFSLGTGVDLHKLDQPFRSLGLEIQFSS